MTCPECDHADRHDERDGCTAYDEWSGPCPCALSPAAVAEAVATWDTHTATGRRAA